MSSYVEACLQNGAQIVPAGTKCEGAVILCPKCRSEADLDPTFEGESIASFRCGCGNEFAHSEAELLTFKVAKQKGQRKKAA